MEVERSRIETSNNKVVGESSFEPSNSNPIEVREHIVIRDPNYVPSVNNSVDIIIDQK